ncbi:uncharacterized protein O3C94_013198 [Discoglossus pictus]
MRSVKHRFDDIRAKVRRMMAKEEKNVILFYNGWESVVEDLLSQVFAAGASGLMALQDPASMSASRKSGSSGETEAVAPSEQKVEEQSPAQQEYAQGKEERSGAEGPGSEEEDVIWLVGSPSRPPATLPEFDPTIPLLQRLSLSPGPSHRKDYTSQPQPPPPKQCAGLAATTGPTNTNALTSPGSSRSPDPPHSDTTTAASSTPQGPPSPTSGPAVQVEMLALMRQQMECLRGIQASISANHAEVMHRLARCNRAERKHHLMTEFYLAGLLRIGVDQSAFQGVTTEAMRHALVPSPASFTTEASPATCSPAPPLLPPCLHHRHCRCDPFIHYIPVAVV